MAKLSLGDVNFAANVLESYYTDGYETEDPEGHASLMRVVAFLDAEIARQEHRKAVNDAKRAYAEEHGIPFKNVRYNSKAGK
jgi:hypothetical protein